MKKLILIVIASTIIGTQLLCQESNKCYLIDIDTRTPIQYAHIINLYDQHKTTTTNSEGEFAFPKSSIQNDSFFISHLAYPITIISSEMMMKRDTIFLEKEAIELSEVVLYDIESILDKVYENIPMNYPTTFTDEDYFFRYFTKQNGEKFQIVESIVNLKKQGYFSSNKKGKNNISLHANSTKKNEKLESVTYIPYSFQEIFQMIDWQINITKGYELTIKPIQNGQIKIFFNSTDQEIVTSGEFTGYLIINLEDYAILEMFYEKNFSKGQEIKDLKKGYKMEYIYRSGLRRWTQNNGSRKYKLDLMVIENDLKVTNIAEDFEILFEGSCLLSSINLNSTNFKDKPISVKSKRKSVVEYRSLNENMIKADRIILKTTEQHF